MTLVGGLPRNPEGLRDARPAPALVDRVGDGGSLEPVGLSAECDHRGERVSRICWEGEWLGLGGH